MFNPWRKKKEKASKYFQKRCNRYKTFLTVLDGTKFIIALQTYFINAFDKIIFEQAKQYGHSNIPKKSLQYRNGLANDHSVY